MATFKQFRERHQSTSVGYFDNWAIDDSVEMLDAWKSVQFRDLHRLATFEDVLTENELRRYSVFAARQVQHLVKDEASRNALDVAEKFFEGQATADELAAAKHASESAPWGNCDAATAAESACEPASSVWSACRAISAARSAIKGKDARVAFENCLTQWLRENTKPQFDNPPRVGQAQS
jgi:hypothetical protein